MLFTVVFFVGVAWSSGVFVAAGQHGRTVRCPYRVAIVVAVLGLTLVLPAVLFGAYGFPGSWSLRRIVIAARIGQVGLSLIEAGAASWLLLDTAFVWRERHRIFPFAFRPPL
jgi:hypothetical protein